METYFFSYGKTTKKGINAIKKFLKNQHKGADHVESKALIEDLLSVESLKNKLYEEKIKPLDEKYAKLKSQLNNICSHPHIEVTTEKYSITDEWTQETWYWDEYIVQCPNCDFKQKFRFEEGCWYEYISGEWEESHNTTTFVEGLRDKDRKALIKQEEHNKEIEERQEYERLSKKYGR